MDGYDPDSDVRALRLSRALSSMLPAGTKLIAHVITNDGRCPFEATRFYEVTGSGQDRTDMFLADEGVLGVAMLLVEILVKGKTAARKTVEGRNVSQKSVITPIIHGQKVEMSLHGDRKEILVQSKFF